MTTVTSTTPTTPTISTTPAAPAMATARTAPGSTRNGARVEVAWDGGWFALCDRSALTPGRGVAALLPDGTQVAVFLDRTGRTHVIGNRDPFTGAQVLSRGLLGSAAGRPYVASPLLKQRFDLVSGDCLDDLEVSVPAYRARTRLVTPAGAAAG